jgi:hypothetical protein
MRSHKPPFIFQNDELSKKWYEGMKKGRWREREESGIKGNGEHAGEEG